MHTPQADRVTRQSAIGRFRRARLDKRHQDLEERQSMIIAVAERLVEVMQDTHGFLDDTRTARRVQEERLRSELSAFRIDLHDSTVKALSEGRSTRMAQGVADKKDRMDQFERLKADVVRIVSDDFF